MKNGPKDDISFNKNKESLLLNRERRDLLARIQRGSIEAYSYQYMEAQTINAIPGCEGLMDWLIEWLDNNLILSASGDGWRGDAMTRVLVSTDDEGRGDASELALTGRALKER